MKQLNFANSLQLNLNLFFCSTKDYLIKQKTFNHKQPQKNGRKRLFGKRSKKNKRRSKKEEVQIKALDESEIALLKSYVKHLKF